MLLYTKYFSLLCIFIFLAIQCRSNKKEETLYPEKKFADQSQFPYKPMKINILYDKDSILIYKIFTNTQQKIKHTLYVKNNQFYFFDKIKNSHQGYHALPPYLFLRNVGPDSCYSVTTTIDSNSSYITHLEGFDLCFSKLKNNHFTTIIRFNSKDSLSYSENYFYTENYKIYKIALRYNGSLYWYKMKN